MGIAVRASRTSRASIRCPTTPSAASRTSSSSPPSTRARWPSSSAARRPRSQRFLELSGDDFHADRRSRPRPAACRAPRRGVAASVRRASASFVFLGISLLLARALTGDRAPSARGCSTSRGAGARRRRRGARAHRRRARASRPARAATRERSWRSSSAPARSRSSTTAPSVQLPLTRATGTGRVAWRAGDVAAGRPVRAVRREGPLTGGGVELLVDLGADRPARRHADARRRPRDFPPDAVLRCRVMRPACDSSCPLARARSSWSSAGAPRAAADKPTSKTLYHDGPTGRYLLDGDVAVPARHRRPGRQAALEPQHAARPAGARSRCRTCGTSATTRRVDDRRRSAGTARTSRCPSADTALEWAVRFESVNYRSRVWLNGKPRRREHRRLHPVRVPPRTAQARGHEPARRPRRLARAASPTSRPPACNADGVPTGGWWNYSGIQREVYLQRARHGRLQKVQVRPVIACGTCAATRAGQGQPCRTSPAAASASRITGTFGTQRLNLGSASARADGIAVVHRPRPDRQAAAVVAARPVPLRRQLHGVASAGARSAGYALHSGIRSIKVSGDGRLLLNGQRAATSRGVGAARGLQGRRASRSTTRAASSSSTEAKALGRDGDAHALPAAPVHARAGRPARAC